MNEQESWERAERLLDRFQSVAEAELADLSEADKISIMTLLGSALVQAGALRGCVWKRDIKR